MECALCKEEIEKDWSEYPPTPKCYGCADFHSNAIEEHGPE